MESFIATATFFLFEAKTFHDYAKCFYGIVSLFANIYALTNIFWKIPKIFNLISNFEDAIQKRKFKNTNTIGLTHSPKKKRGRIDLNFSEKLCFYIQIGTD